MKILYLGYAANRQDIENTEGASIAGNKMELGIIEELFQIHPDNFDVISIFPTASFPKVKDIFFKQQQKKLRENIYANQVAFINIPILKQLTQTYSVFRTLKKYVKEQTDVKILVYNASPRLTKPIYWLKKRFELEIICILADPPIEVKKNRSINFFVKSIISEKSKKLIGIFDKIVVLNENAIRKYAPQTPYIVMEGGYNPEDVQAYTDEVKKKNKSSIDIVYSGALTEYSGIKLLIESIKYIDNENFHLQIYGAGPLEDYVITAAKKHKQIVYNGLVSNAEMLKIQQESTFLINPRDVRDSISMVTFPSKIIEYLLSGTPTISTKLNGFTADYLEYINIIDDSSPESMGKSLSDIIKNDKYDELNKKAKKAREYILNNKSWESQAKRISDFIIEDI